MPTATTGEASIHIIASPEVVYDLIADVTTVGERSPECYRAEWVDGSTAAERGARFRGHNRLGVIKWATTCEVTAAERGREFAFTVLSGRGREETRWRYRIAATALWGQSAGIPSFFILCTEYVIRHHRGLKEAG